MDNFTEWAKIIGALAGVAAFAWRVIDEFGSYLRISVTADGPKQGWASALTVVENKGNRVKKIGYSFLLVGPETESPVDTAKKIANIHAPEVKVRFTNDLENIKLVGPRYVEGRAWIPLPFYFSENVDVADETLTYRVPINSGELTLDLPYAIRFYVFVDGRLHRSTQDLFVNSPEIKSA